MRKTAFQMTKLMGAAALICIAISQPAQGQCEITKLLASDGTAGDHLGFAIAISGDVAIAGAPHDGKNGFWSGSAYIYRMDPDSLMWSEETKLLASDGTTNDVFGWSVAIDGDIAVVGAYADDGAGFAFSGSAYVYRYDHELSDWFEEAKLMASDAAISAWFGFSVAISGDVIVVGAAADDESGPESGAVYIYCYDPEASTWIEQAKLLASDAQDNDFFGKVVAIDADLAIVGSFGHEDIGKSFGAAYIFRFDPRQQQWNEEAKLLDPDGAPFDLFGGRVDIIGDLAIAGARHDDDNGFQSGSAFIFRYYPLAALGSKWMLEAKLLASDGGTGDSFGSGVAITDNVALVGSPGHDGNDVNLGAAYVYHFDVKSSQWLEVSQILSSDVVEGHGFGGRVALSNHLAIIGAPGDDDNGVSAGAAYIFAGFSDTDCNNNGEADYCDIIDGTSNDQNNNSTPDECDADLDGNGSVSTIDLLILFSNWGPCNNCEIPGDCPADLDGNCSVGIPDLEMLLENWG